MRQAACKISGVATYTRVDFVVTKMSQTHLCSCKQPVTHTPENNFSEPTGSLSQIWEELFLWCAVSALSEMNRHLFTPPQEKPHNSIITMPSFTGMLGKDNSMKGIIRSMESTEHSTCCSGTIWMFSLGHMPFSICSFPL